MVVRDVHVCVCVCVCVRVCVPSPVTTTADIGQEGGGGGNEHRVCTKFSAADLLSSAIRLNVKLNIK